MSLFDSVVRLVVCVSTLSWTEPTLLLDLSYCRLRVDSAVRIGQSRLCPLSQFALIRVDFDRVYPVFRLCSDSVDLARVESGQDCLWQSRLSPSRLCRSTWTDSILSFALDRVDSVVRLTTESTLSDILESVLCIWQSRLCCQANDRVDSVGHTWVRLEVQWQITAAYKYSCIRFVHISLSRQRSNSSIVWRSSNS
jgi:hypothetical protein